MALSVTLNLPADVERKLRTESANLDAEVSRAYALELFRQGRLSHFELSQVLGMDRFETDAFLKRHHVFEGCLTPDEIEADVRTLERLLDRK